MRGRMDDRKSYSAPTAVGGVMEGETVARVIASRHPDFAVGDHVAADLGWVSHAISDRTGPVKLDERFARAARRRGGKTCGRTGRSRWSRSHPKKYIPFTAQSDHTSPTDD